MRKIRSVFMMVSLALAAQPSLAADTNSWVADLEQGQGNVEFLVIGMPSALKIRGKGASPKGTVTIAGNQASGKFSVLLDAFDTGLKLRNEHMKKKYLETERFPQAVLTLTKVTLPADIKTENFTLKNLPFEGTLALHGVEKPVQGTANIQRSGTSIEASATFSLKIADFAIATPSFAGITLTDKADVTAEFKAPLSEKK